MKLANETAEMTSRVLNKCSDGVKPIGPWRWLCAVQNGARLEDGFLHLACLTEESRNGACGLEEALRGNSALAGGVKLALDNANNSLHLRTDIAVLEEKQLHDRFWWALDGFHDGCRLLESPASHLNHAFFESTDSETNLGELLRETSWPSTERGPNEFTVELDRDFAAKARIRASKTGVELSVEFVRANAPAEVTRRALAMFLLSASGALRLVRAHSAELEGGSSFGMQVGLPPAPAAEEIDHALAALAVAHRACARETSVLLDEAVARCYLAARDTSTSNDHHEEKEN